MATFPTNPAASALDGTEIVPLTQGGTDKRTTVQGIADANEGKSADIASAATTDLSTATAAFVHVTGTTTITGLGTVQEGTRRIVVFDGALTLTHNGTSLILPTGANIATAAGDVATFVSEGAGNWRCVGYTKADGTPLAGGGAPASDDLTIVTEASAFTAVPATHSGRSKLILAGGDVTIDDAETYAAGNVFNIRATAALDLVEDGVTLTPPAGGTLSLDADMSVTVAMTGATTGVVIGQTVAA